jgi:hypothetical protein
MRQFVCCVADLPLDIYPISRSWVGGAVDSAYSRDWNHRSFYTVCLVDCKRFVQVAQKMKSFRRRMDIQEDANCREGFFFRLATAGITFIVIVPLFAYISYWGIRPAFLLTFIVLSIPCAMLLAQKYVMFLQHLYQTKYIELTPSLDGRAMAKELDLLLFEFAPTKALTKGLRIMERAGLVERRRDWPAIVGDALFTLSAGFGSYFVALSFQLDAHFFPIYVALVVCIILPVFLPRSREQYGPSRMRNKYYPAELQRKLFDSFYKSLTSRLSPPSHEI